MNVAMFHLGEGPHPSHRGFAESVDADLISCSKSTTSPHSLRSFIDEFYVGGQVSGYEIVIAEGARPLYAGLVNKIVHGSSLIYLGSEHRLYQLIENELDIHSPYTLLKSLMGNYGTPVMRGILSRAIDGVITVSEFMSGYLRRVVGEKTQIRVAQPYIEEPLFTELGRLNPTPGSKIVTTIGRPAEYKGVDILVEAWKKVIDSHPEAELRIIGDGHPKSYESTTGVTVLGYVEDLAKAYADAGLYVQPSRVDAFAVVVVEALRASVPAIVTETTGAKSQVKELSEDLITDINAESLADRINWWFELEDTKRRELSCRAREIGSQFDSCSRKEAFSREFSALINTI